MAQDLSTHRAELDRAVARPGFDIRLYVNPDWPLLLWQGVPWFDAARVGAVRKRVTPDIFIPASHYDPDNPKSPYFPVGPAANQSGARAYVVGSVEKHKKLYPGGDLEVLQDPRRARDRPDTVVEARVLPLALEAPGAQATITGVNALRPLEADACWDIHPGDGMRGLPTLAEYLERRKGLDSKES